MRGDNWLPFSLALSLVGYLYFLNSFSRTDFLPLLGIFSGLFICYVLWYFKKDVIEGKMIWFILFGFSFRLAAFGELPFLSDDFFRFLWDGNLLHQGIDPFAFKPEELINSGALKRSAIVDKLYSGMNSPQYYSIYPPLNQAVFYLSTWARVDNLLIWVNTMRLLILIGELLGLVLLIKLLGLLNKEKSMAIFYWLNPFVIIEGIGNLHFEILMSSFLIIFLYFLFSKKWVSSILFGSLMAVVKLVPLIWMPFLLKLDLRKGILVALGIGLVFLVFMSPILIGGNLGNFQESLDLYFHSFEFNGSFYKVERALGFWIYGYNVIQKIGSLNMILFIVILSIAFFCTRKENPGSFLKSLILVYFIYLLISTTVHPWYVLPLIPLGIISGYYFPILWSFTAFLSYEAYAHPTVQESLFISLVQYLPVYILAWFELNNKRFSLG